MGLSQRSTVRTTPTSPSVAQNNTGTTRGHVDNSSSPAMPRATQWNVVLERASYGSEAVSVSTLPCFSHSLLASVAKESAACVECDAADVLRVGKDALLGSG